MADEVFWPSDGNLMNGMSNTTAVGPRLRTWLSSPSYRKQIAAQGSPYGTVPLEFLGKNNWQAIVKMQNFIGLGISSFLAGQTPSAAAISAEANFVKTMLATGKVASIEAGGPTEWKPGDGILGTASMICRPPIINLSADPPIVSIAEAFKVLDMPRINAPRYASNDARQALALAAAAGNIAIFIDQAQNIANCLNSLVQAVTNGKVSVPPYTGPAPTLPNLVPPIPALNQLPLPGGGSQAIQCPQGQILVNSNCVGLGAQRFCVDPSTLPLDQLQSLPRAPCPTGQIGVTAPVQGHNCNLCVDQAVWDQLLSRAPAPGTGGAPLDFLGQLPGEIVKFFDDNPLMAVLISIGVGLIALNIFARR